MAYSSGMDGKGSRDPYTQTWQDYGQQALSDYLLKSYNDNYLNTGAYNTAASDPLGIIQDPSRLSAFLDPIKAREEEQRMYEVGMNGSASEFLLPYYAGFQSQPEPNRTFTPTRDEVQRYIDRIYADFMAAGNRNNDAMWLPRMEGDNVVTGMKNSGGGGILDKITGAVEPAIALSGFAGPALGAAAAGGAVGAGGALTADALAAEIAGLTGSGVATGGAIGTGAVAGGGLLGGITDSINSIPNPFSTGGASTAGTGAAEEIAGLTGSGVATGGALGTGAVAGAGGAAAGGAANAASSAIGRILGGTATAADWASVLGTVGSTALGVYGANQQSNALENIANQARADRQPFLNKSLEWLNNPQAYQDGPGKSSLDATLRALSVQGNPFGSPTNIALAGDIANRNWQNAVTGFGNIGLQGQDSRNQLLSNAALSDSGKYDALGYGLENIFNPKPQQTSLAQALKMFGLT